VLASSSKAARLNFKKMRGEEVKMRLLSDDVRMRVMNALHWDLAVPRNRLNVNVENGWVTVSGTVDLPYQKTCAESDARNVAGVVGVTNLIRVAEHQRVWRQPEETAQLSRH
jgi:osmotically-inducible protein OsmY